ncbi:MAG TPA: tyrosine-type recombinase/integrase [Bryobacteraceae bacterium]|nr:tyrosine-type recombinase/integrase [Bryobacteraceae bacterium]HPQ16989.1 tyrosine-type recombinase/integrase [Bryobacteraceae bacterium]
MQRGSLQVVMHRGRKVWRAQWRENGRGRTRILGLYKDISRAEARAILDGILAPIEQSRARSRMAPAVTLRRYVLDEYLPPKSRVWKASTRLTTEQLVEDHILSAFADRELSSITRKELQAHLDGLAERGLSASVVGHVRWQLSAIFRMAQSDGLVSVNPASGLVQPRCKAGAPKRTLSVDDVRRVELILEPRDRLMFRLAVYEGLRPGEIVGLKLGDIQPDGLHIQRRVYRGTVDSPKSERSRRIVPPTEGTKNLLTLYVETLFDQSNEAWLFPSEALSTPISYSNVWRRRIGPALKAAGIAGANYQVLRRTWVTHIAQAERDATIRAKLAGHSVDVHENVYRQPDASALRKAMRRLERMRQ